MRSGHDGRGGAGRFGGSAQADRPARGSGTRLTPTSPRLPDPAIPPDVNASELDRSVRRELHTLSKDNADGVAGHLVMVGRLIDHDLVGARAHAETAVRRAGRVAAVREAMGLVAYRSGEWAQALSEFRTARRLAGDQHLLPLIVDCERALGRPERALELAAGPEAARLGAAERMELTIVVSGIRRDLGQVDAALVALRGPQLDPSLRRPWSARLFYAYADALLEKGEVDEARRWFSYAVDADQDLETDAAERLDDIDGVVVLDLLGDEDDDDFGDDRGAQDVVLGRDPAQAHAPDRSQSPTPRDERGTDDAAAVDVSGSVGTADTLPGVSVHRAQGAGGQATEAQDGAAVSREDGATESISGPTAKDTSRPNGSTGGGSRADAAVTDDDGPTTTVSPDAADREAMPPRADDTSPEDGAATIENTESPALGGWNSFDPFSDAVDNSSRERRDRPASVDAVAFRSASTDEAGAQTTEARDDIREQDEADPGTGRSS